MKLTQREKDILRGLIAAGSNGKIAKDLGLTENTVKGHVARILRKLGAKNRVDAAQKGLVVLATDISQATIDRFNNLPLDLKETARLVAEGLSNGQISRKIYLSEQGVKSRLSKMFRRLGIPNRAALAVLYRASRPSR